MKKTFSWNWFIFKLWIFGSRFREIKISPLIVKNNVVFKTPSISHIDNLIQLISFHANIGHYHFPGLGTDVRATDGLKEQLAQSIYLQYMKFPSGDSKSFIISAFNDNNPIGYCWMRSIPESQHVAWEIYMLSIHPDYQKEGVGEQLSLFCINHLPADAPIFARVLKKSDSTGIRKLLKKLGFKMMRNMCTGKVEAFVKAS